MKILGIAGSLRKQSYNRALIRAAHELAPAGMEVVPYALDEVPLYNGDVEAVELPAGVTALQAALRAADGLLISTPEYNYGVPGVLKNALDWASRPYGQSALAHKPVALIGASPASVGTARAQAHLKPVLHGLQMPLFPTDEYVMAAAHEKVDADGRLVDATSRELLAKLLVGFKTWVEILALAAAR